MSWLHRWERELAARLEGDGPPRHPLEAIAALTDLILQAPRLGERRPFCANRFRLFVPSGASLDEAAVLGPLQKVIQDRGLTLAGPLHLQTLTGEEPAQLRFALDRNAADAVGLLEGVEGLAADRWALVPPAGVLVGRSPEAGLRLGDPTVSRRHLRVWQSEAQNLSPRGSLHKDKRFDGLTAISDGDPLQVGGCRFRFWLLA